MGNRGVGDPSKHISRQRRMAREKMPMPGMAEGF